MSRAARAATRSWSGRSPATAAGVGSWTNHAPVPVASIGGRAQRGRVDGPGRRLGGQPARLAPDVDDGVGRHADAVEDAVAGPAVRDELVVGEAGEDVCVTPVGRSSGHRRCRRCRSSGSRARSGRLRAGCGRRAGRRGSGCSARRTWRARAIAGRRPDGEPVDEVGVDTDAQLREWRAAGDGPDGEAGCGGRAGDRAAEGVPGPAVAERGAEGAAAEQVGDRAERGPELTQSRARSSSQDSMAVPGSAMSAPSGGARRCRASRRGREDTDHVRPGAARAGR